ncbi:hypothetical protein ACHAWO_003674 [Cyclotella atomus]|uniref:Uncharacterized protein n=1 Tax=Cyclotella atomus TaxID=382360 RepID=A0ABD3N2B2_9STRA
MKRAPTPEEHHQISTSFKRVKISTSPGELRLDRDIDLLLHSSKWMPCSQENHPPSSSGRIVELHSNNGSTLIRDAVDPLRIKLTLVQSRERWTFVLQLPRMYPHVPPVVTRVSREILPELSTSGGCDGLSAVMVASSVMQRGEPPVPDVVLVRCAPPCFENNRMELCSHEEEEGLWEIDSETSVYREWSPVSSLGELIEFLISIPEKRRQWWSVEANRRSHLQWMRSCSMVTPVMQNLSDAQPPSLMPSRQYSNQIMRSPQRCHKEQQQQYPSSPCDMEAESLEAIEGSPFIANRFDVGYERGSVMHHWGVR